MKRAFNALFLLLSEDCLRRGQSQKHCDGSHLEMHLFEWLKLKEAKLSRWGHRTRVSSLETSRHNAMISLPRLGAYLAQLVATGQVRTGCVDTLDNRAYIYGKVGCQFGVYADQGF